MLLALQGSFLLPPAGYALLLTRGVLREHVSARATARHVAPYVAAQLVVLVVVLAFPTLVHMGQPAEAPPIASTAPPMSDEELTRRMRGMLPEQPGIDDGLPATEEANEPSAQPHPKGAKR